MKDFINIPLMIISHEYTKRFFPVLAHAIEEFDTPDGLDILKVYDASDKLMEHIFQLVEKKNAEDDHPYITNERFTMLEIEYESDSSIRYLILPWLEKQIKNVVRDFDYPVGLYFFYLISEGKSFRSQNIAKIFKDDEVKIFEDVDIDDFTPLYQMTSFLNHFWYHNDENPVDEVYPDIFAKLCLVFG